MDNRVPPHRRLVNPSDGALRALRSGGLITCRLTERSNQVGQPVLAISIGLIWGFTVGAAIIVPATIVGESLVFVVVRWKFTGFARR